MTRRSWSWPDPVCWHARRAGEPAVPSAATLRSPAPAVAAQTASTLPRQVRPPFSLRLGHPSDSASSCELRTRHHGTRLGGPSPRPGHSTVTLTGQAALAAPRDGNRLLDAGKPRRRCKIPGATWWAATSFVTTWARPCARSRSRDRRVQASRNVLARVPAASHDLAKAATAERNALRAILGLVDVRTTPAGAAITVDRALSGTPPFPRPSRFVRAATSS